jgi:hypothetical protein
MSDEDETEKSEAWKTGMVKYADSFSEANPCDADYAQVLQFINEYLPVKELAGKVITSKMLREFSLVDSEEFDRFLAAAFGKPREQNGNGNSTNEPRQKRTRRIARVPRSE